MLPRPLTALLLDRDGVVNRELERHITRWEDFEFLPGVLEALRALTVLPVPIVVVSNQSSVGRGWVTAAEVDAIHDRMLAAVRAAGGRIDDVFYCPHGPESACDCRKPKPGLLCQAAERHRFDLTGALLLGDSLRDLQAAAAVGATAWWVQSGKKATPELDAWRTTHSVNAVPDLAAATAHLAHRNAAAR